MYKSIKKETPQITTSSSISSVIQVQMMNKLCADILWDKVYTGRASGEQLCNDFYQTLFLIQTNFLSMINENASKNSRMKSNYIYYVYICMKNFPSPIFL